MSGTVSGEGGDKDRIILSLLESVERDGAQTQRRLATDLGIALGLVNIYLKRCVRKGLVKIREAPARRYVYYLTPQGLAEKSRLTVDYLFYSFDFFRRARADCALIVSQIKANSWSRTVLLGNSDLAEIAAMRAIESGLKIVAVVDATASVDSTVGIPVVGSFDEVEGGFDCVIVTDLRAPRAAFNDAVDECGRDRVFVPALLGIRQTPETEVAL
jgi:DNA-binding MarR family transcriptional regulator